MQPVKISQQKATQKTGNNNKHSPAQGISVKITGPGGNVPVSKSWNIPEVVLVRRWAVGVLGIWRRGVGWVKGGANGVSLQAT